MSEVPLQPGANAEKLMLRFVPASSTGWNEGFAGLKTSAKSVWPGGWVVHEEWHLKHSWYSVTGAVSVSEPEMNVYEGAVPAAPFSTATRLAPSSDFGAAGAAGGRPPSPRLTCGLWQSSHSAWRRLRGEIAKSEGLDSV